MATGTHFTTPLLDTISGLMAQMATVIRVATQEDALNVAVDVAGDDVHIGIQDAYAVQIGEVLGVGLSHKPTYEYAGSTNVLKSRFQAVTDLEAMIKFTMQQLQTEVVNRLVATGKRNKVNTNEVIITGGTACLTEAVPIEMTCINEACYAPAAPGDVDEDGITFFTFTGYRCQSNAGFAIDDITRAKFMEVPTEWAMLAKDGLASGRDYWSMYFV